MQERVVRATFAAAAVPRHRAGQDHDGEIPPGVREEVDPHDRRHPAEIEREEQDQHRALPEDRHREAEQRADPRDVVDRPVAPDGGQDPGRDAQDQREEDGEHGELDRDREPLEDQGEDRLPRAPGRPEVASKELAEPATVLDVPGLVEPEEPLELVHHLLAHDRVRADHLLHDGARDEAEHEEDQHGEPEQGQGHGVEADDQVAAHQGVSASITPSSPARAVDHEASRCL